MYWCTGTKDDLFCRNATHIQQSENVKFIDSNTFSIRINKQHETSRNNGSYRTPTDTGNLAAEIAKGINNLMNGNRAAQTELQRLLSHVE